MIKAFIAMFNNYSNQRSGILDCTSVLRDDFDSWRLLGFKPNVPLTHIVHNVNAIARTGPTPAESFERGIKKLVGLRLDPGLAWSWGGWLLRRSSGKSSRCQ
jgi:hypothetical protein